jgi:tetratricopeptide (TPR) repeat protein
MKSIGMRLRNLMKTLLLLVAPLLITTHILAANIPGYPASIDAYDAREVAMLPHYCKYTQVFRDRVPGGNNPVEIERWYSIMGQISFHTMHHYCWGLMKTNRALILVRNQQDRQFYLMDSITEFDFVIQRASPDFLMLPEIFTKKGENLLRLGRPAQGIAELQRAIELKPDYWPPYATISDHFKQVKDFASARQWLEKGLAAAPDAAALRQRLSDLSGTRDHQTPPPQRHAPAANR